jgi:CBS-domain-containing membrane protein
MRAVSVMTPDVICVGPETTVQSVARLMTDRRISGVPVVDEARRVVGIVTEGDLLRRVENGTEAERFPLGGTHSSTETLSREYVKSHGRLAKDVMTRNVVTVSPHTTLSEIADLFEKRNIKRVPVIQDAKLVGIVSRADLIGSVAGVQSNETQTSTPTDQEISGRLVGEIQHHSWANDASVSIIVKNGTVHLWGTCSSSAQRTALRVAAATTPGVKHVVDHTMVDVLPPT